MLATPIATLVSKFNRDMCAMRTSFALIYTDTVNITTGQLGVRMSSNVDPPNIASLLGSLLEPGDEVRQLLSDLFKAHPMSAAVPPPPEAGPNAEPEIVEVPTEQAVETFLALLFSNLKLKGAKPPSPIIMPG